MLRYYQPHYGPIRWVEKDAEIDVIIPAPDITVKFTYHFILCKDRVMISKSHHQYSHMVGERMTTDIREAIKSFLKLDELEV